MSDLDPKVMSIFTKAGSSSALEATKVLILQRFKNPFVLLPIRYCYPIFLSFQKSGIDKLIPNMGIDDFLFDPCGYSMNGINKSVSDQCFTLFALFLPLEMLLPSIDNDYLKFLQGYYMTIHITPELEFSYVSFETNIPQSSYKDVISRVIETFKPGKFVVTIFANQVCISTFFCFSDDT